MCWLLAFWKHWLYTILQLREFHMKIFSFLGSLYFWWGTCVNVCTMTGKKNKQFHEIYCVIIKMCGVYEVSVLSSPYWCGSSLGYMAKTMNIGKIRETNRNCFSDGGIIGSRYLLRCRNVIFLRKHDIVM